MMRARSGSSTRGAPSTRRPRGRRVNSGESGTPAHRLNMKRTQSRNTSARTDQSSFHSENRQRSTRFAAPASLLRNSALLLSPRRRSRRSARLALRGTALASARARRRLPRSGFLPSCPPSRRARAFLVESLDETSGRSDSQRVDVAFVETALLYCRGIPPSCFPVLPPPLARHQAGSLASLPSASGSCPARRPAAPGAWSPAARPPRGVLAPSSGRRPCSRSGAHGGHELSRPA